MNKRYIRKTLDKLTDNWSWSSTNEYGFEDFNILIKDNNTDKIKEFIGIVSSYDSNLELSIGKTLFGKVDSKLVIEIK